MNTSLISFLISIPAIIIFIVAILLGIFRRTVKAALKLSTVLVAFFLSIPIGAVVSRVALDKVSGLISSLLASGGITEETLEAVPTLAALPTTLAYSLATPFIFCICFVSLALLLSAVYMFLKKPLKALSEKCTGAKHRAFGALIGAVLSLVLIVGIYTPVVGLVNTVASLELDEADLDGIDGADAVLDAKEYVDDADASPLFVITRAMGGNWLYNTLSVSELNGDKIVLKNELSCLLDAALSATAFEGVTVETLGDAQVEALYNIEASATESNILRGLLPELLSSASNSWLEGKAFLGAQKPEMDEMVSGAFNTLLKIFSTSSRDNIEDDLHTLVSLADAVIDSGMLAKIGSTEELMLIMQEDGVVSSIAAPLYENSRMTPLVPEIINIGLRAAAKALNIPESKEELHSEFTADLAKELNEMSELSTDEMTDALEGKMDEICAEYVLKLSESEKFCLAVGLAYEFNGRSDITEGEVSDFFNEYTAYIENDQGEIVAKAVNSASVMFVSYAENKAAALGDEIFVTFKNGESIGEFITIDSKKNADGSLTITKGADKKSGAAYAAALMKLLSEQAIAISEGKTDAESAKLKLMELTLEMSGSTEHSEKMTQSISSKMEKDIETGTEIQPKLAAKPEDFPTEIPVTSDLLFNEDFVPVSDSKNDKNDKDDKGNKGNKDDKNNKGDKDNGEDNKESYNASAQAVEKIAKAVSTLSTVLVNNTNITENMAVIMEKTGAILDGISEISENGSEKASLLTKSILSSDLISERIPVSKETLIGMAEVISNDVIKAREEEKNKQNEESDTQPDDKEENPPAATEALITVAPVTSSSPVTSSAAPVTSASPVTTAVTTAPVTTAPVTTAPVTTVAPGYENFFGATGQLLVNIMTLTGDASDEEKFDAIEAMMQNITPTSAKALAYVCSADLLMKYGVDEKYAEDLAYGLYRLFDSLSEEVSNKDRAAIRSLFPLVFINREGKTVFAGGEETSILDITAYSFVKTILSSQAVCQALDVISININRESLSEFDEGSLKIAFEKNYKQSSEKYQKDAIDKLSKIFGVDYYINPFDS